ncbi:MAG: FHA domain-containing protein [Clostridia bacterium]|nr:FHA domain-containing protein [Clostridia bacterium]
MLIAGYVLLGIGIVVELCTVTYSYFSYLRSWDFYWMCVNTGEARATVLVILMVFSLGLVIVGIVDVSACYIVVNDTRHKEINPLNVTMPVAQQASYTSFQKNASHNYPSMGRGTIVGLSGSLTGQSIVLGVNEKVVIGRDPQICNLIVEETQVCVSRKHCIIRFNFIKDLYEIYDCSTNGTYCNGKRLSNGFTDGIPRGSIVFLGSPDILFKLN